MATYRTSGLAIAKEYQKTNTLLLKCIACYVISNLRSYNMTQKDLADAIGVGQSTISAWGSEEEGKSVPTLLQVLKICNAIHVPFNVLLHAVLGTEKAEENSAISSTLKDYIRQFEETDSAAEDHGYDNSRNHLSRLKKFQNREYIALYLHRSSSSSMIVLNQLDIITEPVDQRGFCPFTMQINGKSATYTGKIVSPPNTYYTYFYLTGGEPTERGMWVLYYPPTIDDDYLCGSGVLLSIDRSTHSPSFQWIILIEKNAYSKEYEQTVFEYLKKDFPESDYPVWVFSQDSLKQKHEELYAKFFSAHRMNKKKSTPFTY